MRKLALVFIALALVLPGISNAQQPLTALPVLLARSAAEPPSGPGNVPPPVNAFADSTPNAKGPDLVNITPMPRMAPELALSSYEQRLSRQPLELVGYSATQVYSADLPDTKQKGEWELQRHYVAPKTLEFKPLRFVGDGFVKTNVIARLLKSEVEHVQNDTPASTALTEANYKFKYKGIEAIDGQPMHVFELKPRQKRPGLIKGKMYLDVHTGALRRVAGELVKSPSFFVKKLEFVQDYADFGGFTFPVHVKSEAKTRLVGRARVEITTRDYTPVSMQPSALQDRASAPTTPVAATAPSN